ncbi:hypothetical protein FB446DRAFT_238498 [Lentinula raphanica]|nr:hypothetical protein FB446DRAFT_238498 [Lentinula raphanica]
MKLVHRMSEHNDQCKQLEEEFNVMQECLLAKVSDIIRSNRYGETACVLMDELQCIFQRTHDAKKWGMLCPQGTTGLVQLVQSMKKCEKLLDSLRDRNIVLSCFSRGLDLQKLKSLHKELKKRRQDLEWSITLGFQTANPAMAIGNGSQAESAANRLDTTDTTHSTILPSNNLFTASEIHAGTQAGTTGTDSVPTSASMPTTDRGRDYTMFEDCQFNHGNAIHNNINNNLAPAATFYGPVTINITGSAALARQSPTL